MVHSKSIPVHSGRRRGRLLHALRPLHAALLAAGLLATLTATAQHTAKTARPDPLDAQASVPGLRYESSLVPVRRQGDDKPVSWREANDTVTRIGGWRVYLREAQQPDPTPAASPETKPETKPAAAARPAQAPPADKTMSPPAGHRGHKSP